MLRKYLGYGALVLVFILSISLYIFLGHSNKLKYAFDLAGENRAQLEAVITHYEEEGDTLKLEAARFLIENMPGHRSYADQEGARRYYDAVDTFLALNPGADAARVRLALDSLGSLMLKSHPVQDARIISAEFLIRNIDEAVDQWRNGPWAQHVGFDDFCEFLLPYKTGEYQPFDSWRSDLKTLAPDVLDNMQYCDQLRNLTLRAADEMGNTLFALLQPQIEMSDFKYPVLRLSTRMRLPSGTCRDYAAITASAMRAQGIPVAIDFTPLWAGGDAGHTWLALLASTGKTEPFTPLFTAPGNVDRPNDRIAKVFRHTYAPNPDIMRLKATEKHVPEAFRDPFMRDVTGEYVVGNEVVIKLEYVNDDCTSVYLAMFDNVSWQPVDFAPVKNGKATFHHVGRGALYLPVCYDGLGRQRPVSDPVAIALNGEMACIRENPAERQDMVLDRKYSVRAYVHGVTDRIKGAELQASDNARFTEPIVVYRVPDCAATGHSIRIADSIPPMRYWRYTQARDLSFCSLAELAFHDAETDTVIRGTVIGTDGSLFNNPRTTREAVFDGDLLTYFDCAEWDHGYVGMDFGRPVRPGRITFTPRGDGNSIDVGDMYELCIWRDGKWKALRRKKATDVTIRFENVPSGGLYLLRDLTKGKEERPFTYRNGRQIWW